MATKAEVLRLLRFRDQLTTRDVETILDYVDQEVGVAIGGHDNLGDHTATESLKMEGFDIDGVILINGDNSLDGIDAPDLIIQAGSPAGSSTADGAELRLIGGDSQDLGSAGDVTIRGGLGDRTAGGAILIFAGAIANGTTATGGVITILSGTGGATGETGSVNINTPTPLGGTANAGKVSLRPGAGGSAGGTGGLIELLAGNGQGGGPGGEVTVDAGTGNGAADGGAITVTAGTAGATGQGGAINIIAGTGGTFVTNKGGVLNLEAGPSGVGAGTLAAFATLRGGAADPASAGFGGTSQVVGGSAGATGGGGQARLEGGAGGVTSGAGGGVLLRGGSGLGAGSGDGGDIDLEPGQSVAGTAGTCNMHDGNGAIVGQFDTSVVALDTRFLVYDVDRGTLERVSVGVADSGGVGFKVLRVQNT